VSFLYGVLSWLVAMVAAAALLVSIPMMHYYLDERGIAGTVEARPIEMLQVQAPKKHTPPPRDRRPPTVSRTPQGSGQSKIARQSFEMDLGPGGLGGAQIASAAVKDLGQLTFEEGETDSDAQMISGRPPKYPEAARKAGVRGQVVALLTIDERGTVARVEVVQSPGAYGFEEAIREAVTAWRFKPAMNGGVAVSQRMEQPFEF
jgi:protein TonB